VPSWPGPRRYRTAHLQSLRIQRLGNNRTGLADCDERTTSNRSHNIFIHLWHWGSNRVRRTRRHYRKIPRRCGRCSRHCRWYRYGDRTPQWTPQSMRGRAGICVCVCKKRKKTKSIHRKEGCERQERNGVAKRKAAKGSANQTNATHVSKGMNPVCCISSYTPVW
jgi:hypothetical protein